MRSLIARWLVVTAVVAWGMSTLVQPASAAFPGANGKVAFQHGIGSIWTMNPDGTDRVQLLHVGRDPKWSPDGSRIVFWGPGIHVMNADGTDVTFVGDGLWPSWSPDGDQILFTQFTFDGLGLWIMNADGSDPRRITDGQDVEAVWSPDGSRIAFIRQLPGTFDLYVAGSDGSAPTELANQVDGDPDWSPDGQAIAFYDRPHIKILRQGVVRTTQASLAESPGWSPDGSKILYSGPGADQFGDLFVMNANGFGPVNITHTPWTAPGGQEGAPDWQPLTNRLPDCASVVAAPASLFPPNRHFEPVRLMGASDPDGDTIELSVTGVSQDEPVTGRGDSTAPDARLGNGDQLDLRAERSPQGDGRVYQIVFRASDGRDGACTGEARVEVPRHRGRPTVESPGEYDSMNDAGR